LDQDGTISQVDYFESGNPIGSSTVSPFSLTLSNLTDGAYVLTARATDNSGGTKLSAPVSFTVTDPKPPTIVSAVATTNEVFVTFSKRLSGATAETPSRYTLTGPLVN